jgi:hypothetical protein
LMPEDDHYYKRKRHSVALMLPKGASPVSVYRKF